jgi:hypothetical protein
MYYHFVIEYIDELNPNELNPPMTIVDILSNRKEVINKYCIPYLSKITFNIPYEHPYGYITKINPFSFKNIRIYESNFEFYDETRFRMNIQHSSDVTNDLFDEAKKILKK